MPGEAELRSSTRRLSCVTCSTEGDDLRSSVRQPTVSGFITAVELGHQRKRVCKISTGSKQLDAILGGYIQ